MTLRRSSSLRRLTDEEVSIRDRDRSGHTGTQATSTITGLDDAIDDLDGAVSAKAQAAALGVAANDANLGEFDNPLYIPDNETAKGALNRLIAALEKGVVNVRILGAVGDGVTNDSAAFQAAINTGKMVFVPKGTYIANGLTYTGRVNIYGEGEGTVILSDSFVLTVTNGTGSTVDNLLLQNITAPWTIVRNPSNWAATMTISQSNDGYQPTVNDSDVWSGLTTPQQTQDVGPKIFFQGNASNIQVSRIYGRFVTILMYDTVRSSVYNCDFKAGKVAILFWNINGQVGEGNRAYSNHVRQASFNGIGFARNTDGFANDNVCEYVGESGLKLWQDDIAGVDARCYRMSIKNNMTRYNYYDGFDLSSDYANPALKGSKVTGHDVSGNRSYGNRQTGFFGDGKDNKFTDNESWDCGKSGIELAYSASIISKNVVRRANLSNAASGVHQISIIGNDNAIEDNFAVQTVANGSAIYIDGTNTTRNNKGTGGPVFEGNRGSITSNAAGNFGSTTTRNEHTVPVGFRQNATGVAAVQIYNEDTSFSDLLIDFFARLGTLQNPIARIRALLALGAGGAELGFLQMMATQDGDVLPGMTIAGDNSIPGRLFTEIQLPGSAPPSGNTGLTGNVAMWLDEAGNALKFQVKYAGGTVKTGSIALT